MIIGVLHLWAESDELFDGGLAKKRGSERCTYAEVRAYILSAQKALDGSDSFVSIIRASGNLREKGLRLC